MTVRTRFAPSPTGVLHLGSVRTALYSWLFARRHGGKFILRIEDTDKQRSKQINTTAILEAMQWLGLDADEGPIFQSERSERYRSVLNEWLRDGIAYRCFCTKERLDRLREGQRARGERVGYDGRCRNGRQPDGSTESVVRFKNPGNGQVIVRDAVRGDVQFENAQLDDLVIARSDGSPTYNFSVVIDDFDMKITHVIRGDDHLNNTPRQMNMLSALNAPIPVYAHLPMILGPDGTKLSKRHGAVDIRDYESEGYLPMAMLNYLVRLGWSHGDQEIFSLEEMIRLFDIDDINQSASSFSPEKLTWVNQQHILAMPADRLGPMLEPYLIRRGFDTGDGPSAADVAEAFRERADTLAEMAEKSRIFFEDFDTVDPGAAKKFLRPVVAGPLSEVARQFDALEDWCPESIHAVINDVANAAGIKMGKLGQPMRVAVTGGTVSPPIDTTVWLIGKSRVLRRIEHAQQMIESRARAAQ